MSIQRIQIDHLIEDIAQNIYSSGIQPDINDVLGRINNFFSFFPAGLALPVPDKLMASKAPSNVDTFNEAMARVIYNLYVLYECCGEQIEESLQLVSTLTSRLDYLSSKRRSLLTKVDDYLLSLNNTSGYFFSLSDNFSSTGLTDLSLTSAFVDVSTQAVVLPTLSNLTRKVGASSIGAPSLTVFVNGVASGTYATLSEFSGALDGLDNTAWVTSVTTSVPSQVEVRVMVTLGNVNETTTISRFDYIPYGITPVQMFGQYMPAITSSANITTPAASLIEFGNQIQTSTARMTLINDPVQVTGFEITLIKKSFDYITTGNGAPSYVYLFGAKEIVFTQMVYDNQATFVSAPLSIPPDLQNEAFIDAVSLSVNDIVPNNTAIQFYVATDSGTQHTINDFSWHQIDPIGTANARNTVINFNGVQQASTYIRSNPSPLDLRLTAPDNTNATLALRNPSPSIIQDVDIYRLASFDGSGIPTQSISLIEGVNTTRIYSTAYNADLVDTIGLGLWSSLIKSTSPPELQYGRIDTGNKFFYGGNIGESNISIFIETYISSLTQQEQFLADCSKSNANSQTWDVRVYLNGNDIGFLPAGTNVLTLPWLLRQGLNHVCLTINIPSSTSAVPSPYLGQLDLMVGHNLFDFGLVQLSNWNYVSFFDLQYNTVGTPPTFTIQNGQIISRRQPTDNFLLQYAVPTAAGPTALRVRADLSRQISNVNVSPQLNSYQLKFAYGEK